MIYGRRPGARLVVLAKDYFPTSVDPLSAPETIVLKRGFEIDLHFASDADLGDAPGELKVELLLLERDEGTPRQIRRALEVRSLARGTLGENDCIRLRVPEPGEYTVKVAIDYATRPGYSIGRTLQMSEPLALAVAGAGAGPSTYDVEIPGGAYREALAIVRARFDSEVTRGMIPASLPFGETHVK